VRERLFNAGSTTTATGVETLHGDGLANIGLGDDESVDVEVMVVFRIGNRRFKRLLDGACNALAGEFELGESAIYLLATDKSGNQVEFLGADAERTGNGLSLIVLQPA